MKNPKPGQMLVIRERSLDHQVSVHYSRHCDKSAARSEIGPWRADLMNHLTIKEKCGEMRYGL